MRTGTEVVDGLWDGERLAGVRARPAAASGGRGDADGAGEELYADAVVLATGAWSGRTEWLPEHARPAVRPVKGEVLELRNRDGSPPCGRILASERVYLVPRPDGRLIVGATTAEQGFDTAVTAGGVHELLREAYRLLPDVAEMELVGAIAGLRPGIPDNLPLIGPGAIPGLVLATGHYRNGILLAPLTAERIAELLTAGEAGRLRQSFGPDSDRKDCRNGEQSNRAAELAARGAALAAAAEAAERASEVTG